MILSQALIVHINRTDNDIILCGNRDSVYKQLMVLGYKREEFKGVKDGFIDENFNFYTKKEALVHAYESNQITKEKYEESDELKSEDLW